MKSKSILNEEFYNKCKQKNNIFNNVKNSALSDAQPRE